MNDEIVLWVGQAFAVTYGLVIGSFLAVCIVRLPQDRSLFTSSACPRCGVRVSPRDNVPVFSYLWLRGRCRHCGGRISPLYALVEALAAVLALLVFRQLFTDPADLDWAHVVAWIVRFGFLAMLLVAAAVDVRHRIIPDQTSIYAVPFGIAAAFVLQALDFTGAGFPSPEQAVFGAAFWGSAFALLSWGLRYVTGLDALGWGDVKLVAMMGAFMGFFPGMFTVLLFASVGSSVFGLLWMAIQRKRAALPMGPPLALVAAFHVLWGPALAEVFDVRFRGF